jgi:anti-sigma B factor antagonist
MSRPISPDAFTIERHGEVTAVLVSVALEQMEPALLQDAGSLLLDALGRGANPQIAVDLSAIDYFGSSFLGLLLRCWKLAQSRNGTLVLAGASPRVRELLHVTSLDMVWPIYGNLREAIEALQAD